MYRAHCCSLLDAVVAANFEAVRDLVLHFWTSISESTLAIVSLDVVLDVVTVWDSYLYGSCRSVLSNADHTHCILDDLNGLDLDDVATEAFCCLDDSRTTFDIGVAELISLLKKHASVEDLTEWLDMAMDNAALDVCITSESKQSRSHVYKDFMLSWMLFFSAIMRHLTLSGSPSFEELRIKMASAWAALSCSNRE
ncbi:hypothetical protein IscW_ISCW004072 [Ixodes scapularis]|uniref:RFX1-4/6/8-like BCD domain-containing protein n=1 Tax=Ixodes scapularis TaxID=6945 RepID=B7PJY5_IXOSC|nr:hypothetical protein IscW_ISCW004072 [Ixodes scapularis]|eukprot:XP_002408847.1 hypothetical protein IscW_ISCW004072 [Ixodes scapularis]